MNEVWVPSNFSRDVFISSGVEAAKVRVVAEGVNTTFFDPAKYRPAKLPVGDIVFGRPKDRSQGERAGWCWCLAARSMLCRHLLLLLLTGRWWLWTAVHAAVYAGDADLLSRVLCQAHSLHAPLVQVMLVSCS
jgi:hypothetical protein